jgi:phage tail sheath protein FI
MGQLSELNVDDQAGLSVNAIRNFTGKGTLVFGARTLAGNDNNYRYVSVRRFLIMLEQSVKNTLQQFVFEPNDANTWTKVRSLTENFCYTLWRAGALQGAKAEQAFNIQCGLGTTMTAQDILNGFLRLSISVAVDHPAEFIVIQVQQQLAVS